MATNKIKGLTVEIGGDTTKLGKALENVNKKTRDLSGELGDINRLLKLDPGNTDLLGQKMKVLGDAVENTEDKLKKLREAEKQVQKQFQKKEVSEAQYRELQREIIATEKKLDGYKRGVKETEQALRGMDEETKEVKESTSGLGTKLASVAKTGLAAVATACTAAVAGLTAAAESTREYRTEMGKLDAAFSASGHTSGTASKAYKELVGVIGETDQSVEAAQQIALLAKSEEDVSKWAGLASGVVGRFGDALQPETFFEAANETIKLGESTGAYTQMLEGCGINVEKFNEGLAACKTEQEKQAYMLKVTEGALGAAGEAYEKNNADIIEANKANDNWMQSLAGVGGAVEPIITKVKNLGAGILNDMLPGIKQLSEAFQGLFSGDAGAADGIGAALSGMVQNLLGKVTSLLPTLLQVGGSLISNLATGIITNLPTMAQKALDAVSSFVAGFQQYLPIVLQKGAELLGKLGEGIRTGLPGMVSQALDAIMRFATTIYDNAPKLIETGFDLLKNLVQGIMNSLPTLISKVPEIISKFANTINDNFPTILKKGAELIWQIIKGIISAIPTLIKNIPKIITAIVDVWEAFNWLQLGKKALKLLGDGIKSMVGYIKTAGKNILNGCTNALKNLPQNLLNLGKKAVNGLGTALKNGWSTVKSGAKTILDGIVNYFKNLPSKLVSVGKDIVKGLWNGISDMTGWVIGKIQGFGESVLGGIKNFFGIKSPSTVMRDEVGAMLDEGLAKGITDNAKQPVSAMQRVSAGVLDSASTDVGGVSFQRQLQSTGRAVATVTTGGVDTSALLSKLDGIYERLGRIQMVTETGALVGEIVDKMDAALGNRQLLKSLGV